MSVRIAGLTSCQLEALVFVAKSVKAGNEPDLDEILEAMSWKPTKDSFQFVIRALVKKGYVFKAGNVTRRDRKRVIFGLTKAGASILDPRL